LINALFGIVKAETDVIPTTEGVIPYLLERPGLESAIILDSEGYGHKESGKIVLKRTGSGHALRYILLVISAVNAARDIDQKMLMEINETISVNPRNKIPPLIVVMTHIDQLQAAERMETALQYCRSRFIEIEYDSSGHRCNCARFKNKQRPDSSRQFSAG